MVHTFSLIHDDLPALDDDDLRRGHADLAQEVRRGDGDPGRRRPAHARLRDHRDAPAGTADAVLRVVRLLADASGRAAWSAGRWTTSSTSAGRRHARDLRSIHARKTGAL
jgi:farnesyl diphosphate synthase